MGKPAPPKPPQPRLTESLDHVFDAPLSRDTGTQEGVAAVFPAVRIEAAIGRDDRMHPALFDGGEHRSGGRVVDVVMADLRGRSGVATTHARSPQHPKRLAGTRFELPQESAGAHQLAGQAVADPDRERRERPRIFVDHVEMGIEGGRLVDLRHRHAHFLGQGGEMGGRETPEAVLHQVEVLDEQVAAARALPEQRADLVLRAGLHLAALGLPRSAASSGPRVAPPAHPPFVSGHLCVGPRQWKFD